MRVARISRSAEALRSYIIYVLLHNLASFYVSYVFARGSSSPFLTITETVSACHSCAQSAFRPGQRRPPEPQSPEPSGDGDGSPLGSQHQSVKLESSGRVQEPTEPQPLAHPPGHPLGPLMDGAGTLKLFKLFIILTVVLKRKNDAKINGFVKL